ncbi:DinB family protein [Candidatus Vecturithrix granuli]|uniref:DinB family protein n=1 Tax=Vecturithrix granuli TaxID=1499967 RepID=A0A081BZ71_VECG1|nr:DinB family protein [Candidatus Vecturithrix granuli]
MHHKLIKLYTYNWWANTRILDAIESLSEDELETDLGGSFASIYQTINHIFRVEWLFLRRWKGLSTDTPFSMKKKETLRKSWEELEQERKTYFQELDEHALDGTLQYCDTKGQLIIVTLWQAIFQCLNHSTFHRGQIISKFRQIGKVPPSTDFITYCRESENREQP